MQETFPFPRHFIITSPGLSGLCKLWKLITKKSREDLPDHGLHKGNYLPTGLVSVRCQDSKNEMRWFPGGPEFKVDAKSTGNVRQYLCGCL